MKPITEEIITKLKKKVDLGKGECVIYSLPAFAEQVGMTLNDLDKIPFSIRILLENALRNFDGRLVTMEDITSIAGWPDAIGTTIPYMPARVLLQDLTGVPLIVDMAAIREAVSDLGGDASKINPLIPTDLVIDHSIQIDYAQRPDAFALNLEREYERNTERYKLIKWAQASFENTRIIPTGSGIVHQVNLEYLASVVDLRKLKGESTAVIDTCVGTDSHTPMVNGVGVIGWGVGGIEAEAVMLGQPYYMPLPEVIGVKLTGKLPEGTTATDLVLTITADLRKRGLVGKFVEYFGPGVSTLTVPDRATVSNMSPEMGITIGLFPIDDQTISYLNLTCRESKFVERYAREQRLFRTSESPDPIFSDVIEIDLSAIHPTIAGPLNPEEKIILGNVKENLRGFMDEHFESKNRKRITVDLDLDGRMVPFTEGNLVIASITSCTNTSNPSVLVGAGLVAKKAVELGLKVPPWIKTSLAPGSKVVTQYLDRLGLTESLATLGFHLVGYGCTTCIGNSGPLLPNIEQAILKDDLYVTTVLSGNRNYSGRVHQLTRGNFLASPMLVVAYALAGTMDIDLTHEPLGKSSDGNSVYLKDIWPSNTEILEEVAKGVTPEIFKEQYETITQGDPNWQDLKAPTTTLFDWDPESTYVKKPPYFEPRYFSKEPREFKDIHGGRILMLMGDKVSTDHISPAGAIAQASPAGKYLTDQEIPVRDWNTYGARRGNHEIMVRGTFANIRVRNQLTPGKEGWWTVHHPTNQITSVYEASQKYQKEDIPLIVLGSSLYGVGSSRDWAGKGPALLGIKAVIAKDFERIHRSNLVGMGVLPLEFESGQGWQELNLDGTEQYDIIGLSEGLTPKKKLKVIAQKPGKTIEFNVTARIDSEVEIDYFRHGGIMQYLVASSV
ncbi:MAG: aconitate hydratase AcnA [Candidatus Thorarchaeota archaeon]